MKPAHLAALSVALLVCACSGTPPDDGTAPEPAAAGITPGTTDARIAPEPAPKVLDARAMEIARSMSDFLRKSTTFSLHVETWSDETSGDGSMLSLPSESRILVRRPDALYVERTSEKGERRFWYDGHSFTALDVARNLFARVDAPPTIEKTVDMLADKYGIVMPLADLLADDPGDSYGKVADRVEYLGTQQVRGASCHHLSYAAPWLRWQLWVAAEGDPVVRRVQITYLDEPGKPRFLAYLDDWKFGVAAEPDAFTFKAPEGAKAIEISTTHGTAAQDR